MNTEKWRLSIAEAVSQLSILRFFPQDRPAKLAIMQLLERMLAHGSVEQLSWLTRTMIDRVGEWHGPMELRGVLCTRYKPADGIEACCKLSPGFTPEEMESAAKPPELGKAEARKLLASISGK